jgi:hypothetical protein
VTAEETRKAGAGYRAKAAWFDDLADAPSLSTRAKWVGTRAAWKKAGHKGHFRATIKEIAKLCGVSIATAERAAAELTARHYWAAENKPGANIYTLVAPDDRQQWERRVTQWLENEARHNWLEAEFWARHKFTSAVGAAILARGGDPARARGCADHLWAQHQSGRGSLDAAIQHVTDLPPDEFEALFMPREVRDRPLNPEGPTPQPCGTDPSPLRVQSLTRDPLSSANGQSHKYFKSVKDEEVLHTPATARAAGARSADAQGITTAIRACGLCGDAGFVTDAHLIGEDGDVADIECQHDAAANIAEVRRIELESERYWTVKWTAQDIGAIVSDHGIMVTAQSRESYSALGNSE